ncbi:hypothetical protein [Vibrio hangzhouensis]|uniref:hypothetical protein n=1 Tax=Vibrio hangzhouensis TaxID=462991 RepID=UPI001C9730EF|nr:hypothetical protein [Vibrio hangzhouensis]MBY6196832.1 hypothetical protein [Vibrio hangzhouensis]
MPVALCFTAPDLKFPKRHAPDIVELWSKHSGVDVSDMTVTLIPSELQLGKSYAVIGQLNLPSIWSAVNITALQLGLVQALVDGLAIDESQVLVMTSLVESGLVVESGQEVKW